MGKQLGWVGQRGQRDFYDLALKSTFWRNNRGAKVFLERLLADYEVFRGQFEVHESSTFKRKKWFAISLKGTLPPTKSPEEQWYPGRVARCLPLTEHLPTGRVRVSTGGAPETSTETASETPRAPPVLLDGETAPETPRAPPVLLDGENVTYMSDRSAKTSKLQGIESVTVMVADLRQKRRKPNVYELHAALEVVNADRGDGRLAQLRAGNNKTVNVAVLTTPRGDGDASSLST
jgi:hypothetical protein